MLIQWDEQSYEEPATGQLNRLEVLGRSLHYNIDRYLQLRAVIGISQILKGLSFMDVLNRQAAKAILWNREHTDHYVFYYGDFSWNNYAADPSPEELHTAFDMYVDTVENLTQEEHYM